MIFFAVFASVVGVLSAGTYSNRPDGTIACDPALRPVIINSAGTTFSSLGYDGTTPYAADLLCEYQFQAAASDNVILTFADFLTEECTDCGCDYMEVYDGADDTGTLIGTYCGSDATAPPPTLSTGPNAFVRFVTDATTHGTGFQGSYDSGNAACEGGVVITAPSGTFESPNFPLNYGLNEDCTWTFSPPDDTYRVEIYFTSFQLENSCTYDTVDMVDGAGNRINKWWGNGPEDANFRFSSYVGSGDVSIHFTSDISITANGFQGGWLFVQP